MKKRCQLGKVTVKRMIERQNQKERGGKVQAEASLVAVLRTGVHSHHHI